MFICLLTTVEKFHGNICARPHLPSNYSKSKIVSKT